MKPSRQKRSATAAPASLQRCSAGGVTGLITLRTLILAGVPTIGPDALFRLWQGLGFELKFPAGTLQWTRAQDWPDVPALALDVLFRPEHAEHIVNFWTGNVWLWALLAIPLFTVRRTPRIRAVSAPALRWPAAGRF